MAPPLVRVQVSSSYVAAQILKQYLDDQSENFIDFAGGKPIIAAFVAFTFANNANQPPTTTLTLLKNSKDFRDYVTARLVHSGFELTERLKFFNAAHLMAMLPMPLASSLPSDLDTAANNLKADLWIQPTFADTDYPILEAAHDVFADTILSIWIEHEFDVNPIPQDVDLKVVDLMSRSAQLGQLDATLDAFARLSDEPKASKFAAIDDGEDFLRSAERLDWDYILSTLVERVPSVALRGARQRLLSLSLVDDRKKIDWVARLFPNLDEDFSAIAPEFAGLFESIHGSDDVVQFQEDASKLLPYFAKSLRDWHRASPEFASDKQSATNCLGKGS